MAARSPVSHATSRNQALKHGAGSKIQEPKAPPVNSGDTTSGELPPVLKDCPVQGAGISLTRG
jgi:hypothetical protein